MNRCIPLYILRFGDTPSCSPERACAVRIDSLVSLFRIQLAILDVIRLTQESPVFAASRDHVILFKVLKQGGDIFRVILEVASSV